ncbi:CPBP family intramembrane glutamic endopeptidase [Anaerotignum sp.]|uniref:CPBP family intramembrane glutamic endopeptidase n=1 Tax=Anaerotignum sp. TaxID=2039241 RepID=UPI002714E44C|nr:type II CAAX endopeptidase family protein [Anaerotignum sp.]
MKNVVEKSNQKCCNKKMRKNINKVARGIFVYEIIMFLTVIVDMILRIGLFYRDHKEMDWDASIDKILTNSMDSGTSSIIAIFIGLIFLLLYFRKCENRKLIFQSKEKMTGMSFLMILTIFMSAQVIFSIAGTGIEACLNGFGYSIMHEMEDAASTSTTVSMFLYASFIGPIAEEIVFRGFVMRELQKFGKFYAILVSAILFGAFHGNFIQSIFATLVGLVLGYVAMNYSIKWSILIHIINNFIFGDLLSYLTSNLSVSMQSIILYVIEGIFFVGTIAIMVLKRKEMKELIKGLKVKKGLLPLTFTSIWVLIFLAFQIMQGISGIEKFPIY